ncbi:helix-turn-helix domain-containing protein [Streptantibioticus rubrisoli]
MGRRQRPLDPSRGPVVEFAAELRALREAAGNPTFAAMSRRAHRSASVLSEAAGGVEFPTWATVEAFVQACGQHETGPWRDRWERTRDALAVTARDTADGDARPTAPLGGEAGHAPLVAQRGLPASADQRVPPTDGRLPDVPCTPVLSHPVTPHGALRLTLPGPRRRRAPVRLRTVAAWALGVLTGLAIGAALRGAHGSAPASILTATPTPAPSLVIVPPPSPRPWPSTGSGCAARTHWVYQFPQAYAGQVYVLLATSSGQSATTGATITWGAWAWHRSVAVAPGAPAQGVGGTLLLFNKLDTSLRDPLVTVDTVTPACAVFGTAGGTSVAPLTTVDANQGWTSASSAPPVTRR